MLFSIGFLQITNTYLVSIIVTILLCVSVYYINKKLSFEKPSNLQVMVEYIIDFLYSTAGEIVDDKNKLNEFFPLVATYFIYILVVNWIGLTPIFGTIGFFTKGGFIPLFKTVNSDLNSTLSMALISVISSQYFAIKHLGLLNHLKRYFSLNPINLFVGLIELISEFTKVISLSFRLYGNILAGDLVIANFTSLVGFIVPLPFMGLELIVGFVQASVFAMLTLAFTNILTTNMEEHGH